MYYMYRFISTVFYIVLFPLLYALSLLRPDTWGERMGYSGEEGDRISPHSRCVWFHAASVGEVMALKPVLLELVHRKPSEGVLVTTMTVTGRDICGTYFRDHARIRLVPLDFPSAVRRFLRAFTPASLILIETELWPNLLYETIRYGMTVSLINGRMSNSAYPLYRKLSSLYEPLLQRFSLLVLQDEVSRQRYLELGANPDRTAVLLNTKFDGCFDQTEGLQRDSIESLFPPDAIVFTAGSVRCREETIILRVMAHLIEAYSSVYCIVAPRHLTRVKSIAKGASDAGMDYRLLTRRRRESAARLLIVDVMGELVSLYSISDVAFVGGTMSPYGGQNLLEPAAFGIPVLFGPHYDNFQDAGDLFVTHGGGFMVQDEDRLLSRLKKLIDDSELRRSAGMRAKQVIEMYRGSSEKTIDLLKKKGIISMDMTSGSVHGR
jgi:3-deoxy-D-manno-octulosonic-acid transferase